MHGALDLLERARLRCGPGLWLGLWTVVENALPFFGCKPHSETDKR